MIITFTMIYLRLQHRALLVLGLMTKFVVDSTVVYLNIANDSLQILHLFSHVFFAPKKSNKKGLHRRFKAIEIYCSLQIINLHDLFQFLKF